MRIKVKCRFTLVELLMVISIIVMLAAMLLPALGRAKEKARLIQCLGNEKHIGTVLYAYINDFDGYLPPCWFPYGDNRWNQVLKKSGYVTNENAFFCPNYNYAKSFFWGTISYGINVYVGTPVSTDLNWHKISQIKNPAGTVYLAECKKVGEDNGYYYCYGTYTTTSYGGIAYPRHGRTCNILWMDLHVSSPQAPANNPINIYASMRNCYATPSDWDWKR